MKNYKLEFPKFEDILSLSKNKKYEFHLFDFYKGYCRILYNSECLNVLYLDIIFLEGYVEEYYSFGITNEDYNNLKEKANEIYNKMVQKLLNSTKKWDINRCYICEYEL